MLANNEYTRPFPGFIGGYNVDRSIQIDNEILVNLYIRENDRMPEKRLLAHLPGLRYHSQIDPNNLPFRNNGIFEYLGQKYMIVGEKFYRETVHIGNLSTINSSISWTTLPTQVIFTDFTKVYVYDLPSNTFTTLAFPFIVDPGTITSFENRLIIPLRNSNFWYVSSINDGRLLSAERYDLFQAKPDYLEGSATVNGRVLLIGQVHTENWQFAQLASIPMSRDTNIGIDYGTWSPSSIVTTMEKSGLNFVAWLGRDRLGGAVFLLSYGTTATIISNPAIEILLQRFQYLEDCYGITYRIDGHLMIEWSFERDNYTLGFDTTVREWYFRRMADNSYFIGNSHGFTDNTHYIGSRRDSSLYTMSSDYFYYYSSGQNQENIHRSRISPIIRLPHHRIFTVPYFEVLFESGYVNSNLSPKVYLQTSINNNAFGNARSTAMSKIGQYNHKSFWYGLGSAYAMVMKVDIYDPIPVYMLGASFSMIEGTP